MEECAVVNIGGMRGLKIKRVCTQVKEQCVSRLLKRKEGHIDTKVRSQNIKADNATYSVA